MKKSFLFTLAALAFAVSCDKSSESFNVQYEQSKELTADEIKALSWYKTDPRIKADEATLTAQSIIQFLDEQHRTKAAAPRTISGIKPVTRAKMTRSGDDANPDTVAYVFNFGQEEGYAILSADRRTDPIFALVPEGHIDFSEDVDESLLSTGIVEFYGNLEAAYDRQVEFAIRMQDSLVSSALAKIAAGDDMAGTKAKILPELELIEDEPRVEYGQTSYVVTIAPMISVGWGQKDPYNMYTPVITGTHAPTGCAATAVAQLMSYWRYPASYNWSVMMPPSGNETLSTFQTIAHLMTDVGAGLNVKYGKTQSSAYFSDIPGYLSGLGYNPGLYKDYNKTDVSQSLTKRRPVLVAGNAIKKDVYKKYLIFWEKYSHTYYEGGHAWIIDGAMKAMTPIYVVRGGKRELSSYVTIPLVHCNWGWPEYGIDGYYNEGSFNINNGPVTRAHTETYGTDGNFQYNIECITNIYK